MPPLVKQACLVLMAFLSNLLTYSDLPKSPRFPSLSMILYWDFYNYLCLLHPYHNSPIVWMKRQNIFLETGKRPVYSITAAAKVYRGEI